MIDKLVIILIRSVLLGRRSQFEDAFLLLLLLLLSELGFSLLGTVALLFSFVKRGTLGGARTSDVSGRIGFFFGFKEKLLILSVRVLLRLSVLNFRSGGGSGSTSLLSVHGRLGARGRRRRRQTSLFLEG